MLDLELPLLKQIIDSEDVLFSIQTKKEQPTKKTIMTIVFGFVWSIICIFLLLIIIIPVLNGKEVNLPSRNAAYTVTSADRVALTIILLGFVFLLIMGILILVIGTNSLSIKNLFFIGTSTKLIKIKNDFPQEMPWNKFTKNILLNENNITLEYTIKNTNNKTFIIPIYLYKIENSEEIKETIAKLITDNQNNY